MELIARVAVRRHRIGEERDGPAPDGSRADEGKVVTLFRIRGGSPARALRLLARNTRAAPARPTVALTVAGRELSDAQAAVCRAVITQCRSDATEIVLCSHPPQPPEAESPDGFGNCRWFPSVHTMVQQFGREDAQGTRATPAPD